MQDKELLEAFKIDALQAQTLNTIGITMKVISILISLYFGLIITNHPLLTGIVIMGCLIFIPTSYRNYTLYELQNEVKVN